MELGDQTWSSIANGGKGKLALAVSDKLVTEARVTESVERILHLRFITGQVRTMLLVLLLLLVLALLLLLTPPLSCFSSTRSRISRSPRSRRPP